MKIDRDRIVDEALKLLNEVGLDALSTRALAERLGIKQPALYWHFRNKRALIEAMNDEILRRGHHHQWPVDPANWREFVAENARSFRSALLAYRDGARVHAGTEANPQELASIERHIEVLTGAGMGIEHAMELLVAVGRYTVGCVIEEQSEPPAEREMLDRAAVGFPLTNAAIRHYRDKGAAAFFERGLEMLIEGAGRLEHVSRKWEPVSG